MNTETYFIIFSVKKAIMKIAMPMIINIRVVEKNRNRCNVSHISIVIHMCTIYYITHF